MTIKGTSGNDIRNGTGGNDVFRLWQGGDDTAHGFHGRDIFRLRDALDSGDSLDGGSGWDKVVLSGDYSAGLVFGASTIANIEALRLGGAFDYNLTLDDGNVAAHGHLAIHAESLGSGHQLTFDGSAETNGYLKIFGSAGDDDVTGGAKGDKFYLGQGGGDTAYGGGGQDKFILGGALTASDTIDGGGGTDTLRLAGNYAGAHAVVFGANTVTNIERMFLGGGHSYDLTTDDATVASGKTLNVDASALGAGDSLTFDGSAETGGRFVMTGGAGDDMLTGGDGNDNFNGGDGADTFDLTQGGADTAYGGDGTDIFYVRGVDIAGMTIDGGAGTNAIYLSDDVTVALSDANLTHINNIDLVDGDSYTLSFSGDLSGGFAYLSVNATDLHGANTADVDYSGATSGALYFFGSGGDDTIRFGGNFGNAVQISGNGGNDTVMLDGDYSGGVAFGPATMTNVENLTLLGGHSYDLTTDDATVGAFKVLFVDASTLGAGDSLTFDGSAETDGSFYVTGGAGDDTLTGGDYAVGDSFYIVSGGTDTVYGGGGDDQTFMGANMTAADTIDGGAGTGDIVYLDGDYSAGLTFGATTMTNVNILKLGLYTPGADSYDLTTDNATVANGGVLYRRCVGARRGRRPHLRRFGGDRRRLLHHRRRRQQHHHRGRIGRSHRPHARRHRHGVWRRRQRRHLHGRVSGQRRPDRWRRGLRWTRSISMATTLARAPSSSAPPR